LLEKEVPLATIAWKDRRFSFSRGGSLDDLVRSIEKTGLVVPPDLLFDSGRYIVIRGFRRLHALRRMGQKLVRARVFSMEEISPIDAWSMNFHENSATRTLNPAEGCTVLRQLVDIGLSRSEISAEFLPLLGLPRREGSIDDCLSVAGLPEAILDSLAGGEVTFPAALFLTGLDESDRRSAFRFLKKAGLTVSQQREWARLTADISARDGLKAAVVLTSVSRAAARRPGRFGQEALQVLRERRYPSLAARRRAFVKLLRGLKLPPHIQITTHPFFEKSEVSVRLSVSSPEAYTEALRLLERVGKEPSFRLLMESEEPEDRK